jgi:hypothetical protein
MSPLAWLVVAIGIFVGGVTTGIKWHAGQDAIAAKAAQEARDADVRQQRRFNDKAAGDHAAALQTLNDQLGDARAKLARLSGRSCLSPSAVGVLNDTGVLERRTAASEPARAASAASAGTGLRWATDIDLAGYIAVCRTRYAAVANQLNEILDIEDRRHPAGR